MKLVVATTMPLKDHRGIEFSKNKKDIEIFRQIHGVISDSWLVDRFNKINLPFNSLALPEYNLNFSTKPIDLATACYNRSKELISTNKKIYVLWSGGIDSTLVVTSLLQAGIPKDQIFVVCNTDSQRENYNFFLKILNSVNLVSTEKIMQTLKYKNLDGLVLSAEHGDLSYGYDFSSEMLQMFGSEYLKQPATRENIVRYFTQKKLNDQSANCWYDVFIESAKMSPRPIDTVYDFSWWAGFNWRWQYALEKFRMRFYRIPDSTTFFLGHDIQNWSIHHQQPDLNTLKDFKPEYKKIIYNYTGDENYYKNKIKHESTTLYYGSNSYAAVLEDQTRVTSKDFDLFSFYQPDNFISRWLAR
jgi:hypothetical protein